MSPAPSPLAGRTIVVGIGAGIAAYKTPELVRLLARAGARVQVVLSAAARPFVTLRTLQAVSGQRVATEGFDPAPEGSEAAESADARASESGPGAIAQRADLIVLAPATEELLVDLSLGTARDLLSTLALAARAQVLVAPAIDVDRWQQAALQEHVGRLRARGVWLCGPESAEHASPSADADHMSEPGTIFDQAQAILRRERPLLGRKLLISAGPTFEAIDPVRFIGNRSSGKMGFALAAEAAVRGAEVILAAGPVALPTPPSVTRADYESAAQLAGIVLPALDRGDLDGIVMTAAVADFTPTQVAAHKLKKRALGDRLHIELEPTLDILAELGRRRGDARSPLLVGFAAETRDVLAYAQDKLERKRCDVIVANDVSEPGSGFGADYNRVTLVQRGDTPGEPARCEALPLLPKTEVACAIWDRLTPLLLRRSRNPPSRSS
jgi:phosphopantothenoylcysteine decarboxylase/phosphopantothenate--cysteine ligase